jgi:ribonuclease HII
MASPDATRRHTSVASSRVAPLPSLEFERRAWNAGCELVAGVDEAGRGAWAGPLVGAAAIVPRDGPRRARLTRALRAEDLVVNDSKRLTPRQRDAVRALLEEHAVVSAIAVVSVEEIDRVGVGVANRLALTRAAASLDPQPQHLLFDAFAPVDPWCSWEAIVHGDSRSFAIAMASIIAKVYRDEFMERLAEECPGYGFERHKGYGTAEHQASLARLGVCVHHRRSFAPVAAIANAREQR